MNRKEIKNEIAALTTMEEDYAYFGSAIYVVKTGENQFSVCDNGEEVAGLDLDNAVRIVVENLEEI